SASGHMVDMGGLAPGSFAPDARECYQEGVRIPPVRLLNRGEPVGDLWSLILNNVRQRDVVEMDLKSLVAGTHVAAEKVLALAVRVHQLLAHDVRFTDAVLRALRVIAPEGSIVNARPPAPVAAAHMHVGLMVMEMCETCLKKALACALPGGERTALARRITAP